VLYSIYLSHRHRGYWEAPESFMPERFGGEEGRQRMPYLYLPFGGGARNCIGMAFAQVEARIVLAKILSRFVLHPAAGHVSMHMGATLEPHPAVWTRLALRAR
jgi:cytochrome P450